MKLLAQAAVLTDDGLTARPGGEETPVGELKVEVDDLHRSRIPRITRYRITRRKRCETGRLMFTVSRTSVRHTASRYFRINQVLEDGEVLTESDSQ